MTKTTYGLAAADVVLEESTGKDTGEHILAMLSDLVPNQTAATTPKQTHGSDDSDPIDTWLHAEAIYREQFVAGQEPAPVAPEPAVYAASARRRWVIACAGTRAHHDWRVRHRERAHAADEGEGSGG